MEQLLLFKDTDIQIMQREINKLKSDADRVRKNQYGKIGKLEKEVYDLKNKLEIITSALCKGKSLAEYRAKNDYEVSI